MSGSFGGGGADTQAIPSDIQAILPDTQATLSDRKAAIITWLETHDKITTSDISALFGVTNVWARKIAKKMTDDGTIEKVGDNRYTYYVLKAMVE